MTDPLFWLGLSVLLVAFSLTTLLIVSLPAMLALARAASSLEKLADILARELPPTLEIIRLTGIEISELTDDVNDSVESAGEIVKQVDQTIGNVRKQTKQAQDTTKSIFTGIRVAWTTFSTKPQRKENTRRPLKDPPLFSHKNQKMSHDPNNFITPSSLREDSNLTVDSSTKKNIYTKNSDPIE